MQKNEITSRNTKRLIYFIGHNDQDNSVLICKVCKNYETFSKLITGECATRTLLNLYNLHTVRGNLNENNELILNSSMSGPHHYFGWIDPRKTYVILSKKHKLSYYLVDSKKKCKYRIPLKTKFEYSINDINWIKGDQLNGDIKLKYNIGNELRTYLVEDNQKDSLFDNPGILLMNEQKLNIPVIQEPWLYDLSSYKASVVKNDEPFSFDQELISKNFHAQHKLRVITYNYGENYVKKYLMKGSGIFIEKHEFIQAITPLNNECYGYILLGRIHKNS